VAGNAGAASKGEWKEIPMPTDAPTAGFLNALVARSPHPDLGAQADTYGRLIGSWTGEYKDRSEDGSVATGRMEVHFAWVLDGRAVQDLWIAPPLADRRAGRPADRRDTYGSTLRVFDPSIDAWRVLWLNPPTGVRNDLIGRRVGDDIVQTGWHRDAAIKWTFTRITPESFVWQGFELDPDGSTWRLLTEFNLQRRR
jgi:hypothetical protein